MKIIGTGLTGLVGSRLVELLSDKYEFENISSREGIDITDQESVSEKIKNSGAQIVIHFAAKTNVDECEKDKKRDEEILGLKDPSEQSDLWKKEKTAWGINVLGTLNVIKACQENQKNLIHISTDFVFNGDKEFYTEEDERNPLNWYGKTKSEAEELVEESGLFWVIARLSYPYRSKYEKNDFVRGILKKLENKENLNVVKDQIITPTFIDDFAFAIEKIIEKNARGIFNVVGSDNISPYNAALIISQKFCLNKDLIVETTREKYFKDKAQRPFRLIIKNDRIMQLGAKMRSFNQGLNEVKNQLFNL